MLRRLMCRFGRCTRCQTYETDAGIGGRCIDCGRVHGWITREELRAHGERRARNLDHWATERQRNAIAKLKRAN